MTLTYHQEKKNLSTGGKDAGKGRNWGREEVFSATGDNEVGD